MTGELSTKIYFRLFRGPHSDLVQEDRSVHTTATFFNNRAQITIVRSLGTTRAIKRLLHLTMLSATRTYWVIFWASAKYGSTMHQRPIVFWNGGLHSEEGRLSYLDRPERWRLSGLREVRSLTTAWRRAKRLQCPTLPRLLSRIDTDSQGKDDSPRINWSCTMTNPQPFAPSTDCPRRLFVFKLVRVTRRALTWVRRLPPPRRPTLQKIYFSNVLKKSQNLWVKRT